ncbi:ATP-binding protein, partial [Klebsiella pneumoniae]|nr:ATP-binding protein [Klebsiella pneumoniae]
QLRESLRFGAERDYDTEDLGKFGLGLKTASLSQCLRLTVASRQNEGRADINAYCWDLGHIEATNRWEILPVKSIDLQPQARQHLKETTGTVVIWERLDRILGYKRPDGEMARKQLTSRCRALEEHVAMVFHRFLEGAVRGKRLAIYLNDNKVVPWDPFA